ncbi:hypothetical protein KSF73_01665 [Burkholderiaceae bacterium DAT-1]|nr:hypothetical protein [Burkholderiaceae bacterium DAT-1]
MSTRIDFALPAGRAARPGEFTTPRQLKDWLKQLPLANVKESHSALADCINSLNELSITPLDRLKMLELLREPVAIIQQESSKRYWNRPIPLAPSEAAAWHATVDLWQVMSTAYRHCWQGVLDGDVEVAEFEALVAQRTQFYQVQVLREHVLCRRAVSLRFWQTMLSDYKVIRRTQVHAIKVKDKHNRQTGLSSCDASLAHALLLHLCDPWALSVRQLLWVDHLLERLSLRATFSDSYPFEAESLPIGFNAEYPEIPGAFSEDRMRPGAYVLVIDDIIKSLRKRIKALRSGVSPAELNLGEDMPSEGAQTLLKWIYRSWRFKPGVREHVRVVESLPAACSLAYGIEQMYQVLEGKPFQQPDAVRPVSARSLAQQELFGHQRSTGIPASPARPELEHWQIKDISEQGYRLARTQGEARLSQHQLLLLCSDQAKPVLGRIRWLRQQSDGVIEMGISLVSGTPQGVACQTSGTHQFSNQFSPVLLLNHGNSLDEAELILPAGWFKQARTIEIMIAGRIHPIRLDTLAERGVDFDRCTFGLALPISQF